MKLILIIFIFIGYVESAICVDVPNNANSWETNVLIPALTAITKQQLPEGAWKDVQTKSDLTAQVSWTIMRCGFDHFTPNRFKHSMGKSVNLLKARIGSENNEIMQQLLDAKVLFEALAMTGDESLTSLCKKEFKKVNDMKGLDDFWSHGSGKPIDWELAFATVSFLDSATAIKMEINSKLLEQLWSVYQQNIGGVPINDFRQRIATGLLLNRLRKGGVEEVANLMDEYKKGGKDNGGIDVESNYYDGYIYYYGERSSFPVWMERHLKRGAIGDNQLTSKVYKCMSDIITRNYLAMLAREKNKK